MLQRPKPESAAGRRGATPHGAQSSAEEAAQRSAEDAVTDDRFLDDRDGACRIDCLRVRRCGRQGLAAAVEVGDIFFSWGEKTKQYFPKEDGAAAPLVEINEFLRFLDLRLDHDGVSISRKLGQPEPLASGCWRLPWTSFDEAALPKEPRGKWENEATWVRAWHHVLA